MRYFLLRELLLTGDDAAANVLLRTYPEELSAQWSYTEALVKFRTLGDHVFARRAFAGAVAANPFVPLYLSGAKRLPRKPPAFYGMGDEREAQWYVAEQLPAWHQTPGALAWLRRLLEEVERSDDAARRLQMPDELDPAGPSFFLNPYDNWRHTRCPRCDAKTRPRRRNVVILIDPNALCLTGTDCRYCPDCDLLIAHADLIQQSLTHLMRPSMPDIVGTDYVVLGMIETPAMQGRGPGPVEHEWAMARLKRFRAYEQFTDPWGERFLAHAAELSEYLPTGPEFVRSTR